MWRRLIYYTNAIRKIVEVYARKIKFAMVSYESVIKRIGGAIIIKISSAGCNLLLGILLGRLLGASFTGTFYLTITIMSILSTISRLGMDHALVKLIASLKHDENFVGIKYINLVSLLISGLMAIAITVLIYEYASVLATYLFSDKSLTYAFQYGALALVPMTLMSIQAFCLQGVEKVNQSLFLINFIWVAGSCVVVAIGTYTFSKNYIFVGYSLTFVVALVVASIWWRQFIGEVSFTYIEGFASRLFRTSLPMLVTNVMSHVMLWCPLLLLGVFSDTSSIGIYGSVGRVAGLLSFVLIATNSVIAPKISRNFVAGNLTDLVRIVRNTARVSLILSLPICLVFLLFPSTVLSLFGSEFTSGATALQILCLGHLFNCYSGSVFYTLNMTSGHKVVGIISFISATLLIALSYILIPLYGINGAAIAASFIMILHNCLGALAVYKMLDFVIFPKNFRFE